MLLNDRLKTDLVVIEFVYKDIKEAFENIPSGQWLKGCSPMEIQIARYLKILALSLSELIKCHNKGSCRSDSCGDG